MTPIWTYQYSIKIPAGEFNTTMNSSVKPHYETEEMPSGSNATEISSLRTELTTGSFNPYVTQICLHRNQPEEPLIIANLPRPVQIRDDIDLIITFRLDA